jgi:hypothetical protein
VENEKLIVWKSRILPGQGEADPGVVSMVDQSGAHARTGDGELVIEVAERGGLDWKGLKFGRFFPSAPAWVPEKAEYGNIIS